MPSEDLSTLCSNGDLDQLQELFSSLFSSQPKPSQDDLDTALSKATWAGHAKVAGLLLSQGARITKPAFLGASSRKDTAIFQEFLDHGWDINSTEFGNPALRLVVENEACVRWFLEHGADPNRRGARNATVLATAALFPSTTVLELLLSHGAELDPEALLSAMSHRGRGGVPAMRVLIAHGMDVNTPSRAHGSPLHYAVYIAGVDRTQFLLEKGADRSAKSILGRTPVEMAKERMNRSKNAMTVYEILSEQD